MSKRVGLWLTGAHGGVSTTVAVGWAALKLKLTQDCGLVSQLDQFSGIGLIDWKSMVLGGHEIRKTDSRTEAFMLSGVTPAISRELVIQCESELAEFDRNVRPGFLFNVGETIQKLSDEEFVNECTTARDAIDRIQSDLAEFVEEHDLERVIVVNLASTEPTIDPASLPPTWDELESTLTRPDCPLPASSLYAIAALEKGWPFVNFTPSLGSCPSAIDQLAVRNGTCHMGHDGKNRRDLFEKRSGPGVRAAKPGDHELGRPQHFWKHGWQSPG